MMFFERITTSVGSDRRCNPTHGRLLYFGRIEIMYTKYVNIKTRMTCQTREKGYNLQASLQPLIGEGLGKCGALRVPALTGDLVIIIYYLKVRLIFDVFSPALLAGVFGEES